MNSIKSKIVIFAIIATLLPSAGLGLLSFKQNEALVSDNLTRELRTLADNIEKQLSLWLDENFLAVRALSTSAPVIEGLSALSTLDPPADTAAGNIGKPTPFTHSVIENYLRSVQQKLETIRELTLCDVDGQQIASSANHAKHPDIPERWPHNALAAGSIIVWPSWNDHYETATFDIAFPVLSYDGRLIGAITATLDFGMFRERLVEVGQFWPDKIALLDQNGQILLGSAPEIHYPAKLDARHWELIQIFGEPVTYDGLAYSKAIGLARALENFPAVILVERDYQEARTAWIELRNRFLEFVAMLIIIVTIVALYMGHKIVTPLERLIGAVKGIADGNLETRLPISQKDEVGDLTAMFNQMADALRDKHTEITVANETMQRQNQMLQKLSITDGLTGLYNRGKLDAILAEQLALFKRHGRAFCLLMVDIDHFKDINDDFGHIMGDKILITVAAVLLRSIRAIDYAARYGGDEFMVILTETNAGAAANTAERIRTEVSTACREFTEHAIKVTLSIGITQSQPGDNTSADLIARADAALYEAKHAGRNRVHCIGAVTY